MQALEQLSSPDVTVTNASDKEVQLQKLREFDAMVRRLMQAPEGQELLELRGMILVGQTKISLQ